MNLSSLLVALRKPKVAIAVIAAVVIVVIWLATFFLPEGTKLSKDNAQIQSLQTEQLQLQHRVAVLKATAFNTKGLEARLATYRTLIPKSTDPFPYIAQISDAATAAGVTLMTDTPAGPGTAVPGTTISAISIPITSSSTFDQALAFIKAIYALPRLTSISSIAITGGGIGTTRSTVLQVNYDLVIYTSGTIPLPPSGG